MYDIEDDNHEVIWTLNGGNIQLAERLERMGFSLDLGAAGQFTMEMVILRSSNT